MPSAGGRACTACSCRTCRMPACGARPEASRRPRVRTRPACRPARAERRRNRPPGMHGMHQSGEQFGRPRNGTKRARMGKASGSADRSFGPDAVRYMSVTIATPCPTAAHDETRREKKETARRAAFPQPGGRFRGGGRCWVRTNVGLADGFTDRCSLYHRAALTWVNGAQHYPWRQRCPLYVRERGHPAAALHGQPRTASAERVDLQELGDLIFLTHRGQEPWPSPCNRAPSRLCAPLTRCMPRNNFQVRPSASAVL